VPNTKSTLFVVSKDEWVTKKGTGKSKKNGLYVQRYSKRHLSGFRTSNSEKIKLATLTIAELHKTESISQAVSQSVSQSVSRRFH